MTLIKLCSSIGSAVDGNIIIGEMNRYKAWWNNRGRGERCGYNLTVTLEAAFLIISHAVIEEEDVERERESVLRETVWGR